MTKAKIYSSLLTTLLAILVISALPAPALGDGWKVKIIRDEYGVPHIYSKTQEGVFYGFGYAQAEDSLPSLMLNYLTAKGTLTDNFGPTNRNNTFDPTMTNSESDYLMKLLRIPQLAVEKYDQIDPEARQEMIEPFAEGINAYIDEHHDELPSWITDNAPVTPTDVVTMGRLLWFLFSAGGGGGMGSNQWAISPERSASGNAMYGMNPHLPWDGFLQWYEAHLVGPKINIDGVIFFGLPIIGMGHNEYLAWSETVNHADISDMWIEALNPDNSLQYLYKGNWRNMTVRVETIGGVSVTMLYTHHGAVVDYNPAAGYAVTLNYSANADVRGLSQFYRMGMARNLDEFKEAMSMLASPQFNTMYADIYGNIFYVWNAMCPRRNETYLTYAPGAPIDWSQPVPGWTSDTEWGPLIPFDELPQAENPDSGWLLNANMPSWNVTVDSGIEYGAYPDYLTPPAVMGDYSRAMRLTNLLAEDESVTFKEMRKIAVDVYVLLADGVIPLLPDPSSYTGELSQAIKILKRWDRYATKESVAMTIFAFWMIELNLDVDAESGYSMSIEGVTTEEAVGALEEAVNSMLSLYGTIKVQWGSIHGVLRGDRFFELSGGPGEWGILNPRDGWPWWGRWVDGVWYCIGGSSFIMVVELEEGKVKAYSVLPYGESNDPTSPHFDDQARLFSRDKLKPAWFYWKDVIRHAESVKVLA